MPDASIKGIEFQVQGSTNGASKAIDRLVGKMAKLQSALGNTKSATGYSKSMQGISKATSKTLAKFSKALIATPIKALTDRVKSATGALSKLGLAFKRIVFYRFVRSAIREIGDAFKYGVNNLYAWSQAADGRFAASMDRLATAFAYFKNSVGAAVAPLINALAPAIDYVIDKAVALLNVINQLFARLTGATYWTKAIKQATAYGDAASSAGGAAKEALRYLAPFDELNVLPSDNGGGGGGGGGGSSGGGLFEIQQDFSESISNFAQMVKDAWDNGDWEEVGRFLGGKINDLIENLPWATMGANVGKFINALFGTAYWTLDTVNFTNLGKNIATFVNNAISNIDWDIAGRLSVKQFTVILDTIIGFIEELDWDLVASSISEFVGGAISEFDGWMDDQDWSGLGTTIGSGINKILTETPWEDFIPSMVTFATDILTTINSAISQIHWGPWNEDGTLLNKLYNGLKGADWSGLWKQARQLISNTWPVWTLALTINILPTIGSVVGEITRHAILKAIFGGGAAAGAGESAAAAGVSLTAAGTLALGSVLLSIPLGIVLALKENEIDEKTQPFFDKLNAKFKAFQDKIDAWCANFGQKFKTWWNDLWDFSHWDDEFNDLSDSTYGSDGTEIIPDGSNPGGGSSSSSTGVSTGTGIGIGIGLGTGIGVNTFSIPVIAEITDTHQSGKFDVDSNANLTSSSSNSLTDAQKTIETKAYFNTREDKLSWAQRTLSTRAGFNTRMDNLSWDQRTLSTRAGFNTRMDNLTWEQRTLSTRAGFNSRQDNLTWDQRTLSSRANFNSRTDSLSSDQRTLNSKAKFTYSEDGLTWEQRTLGSTANFTSSNDSIPSWEKEIDWCTAKVRSISDAISDKTLYGFTAQIYNTKNATGGVYVNNHWNNITRYASGGLPRGSQLFWAREAGPELVGTLGGHTAVMNNDQIVASVSAGVARAISSIKFHMTGFSTANTQTYDTPEDTEGNMVRAIITALQTLGIDGETEVYLDGEPLYQNMVRRNRAATRATGNNPMMGFA